MFAGAEESQLPFAELARDVGEGRRPVAIAHGSHKRSKARLLNLSQGGVAVQPQRGTLLKGKVRVDFRLPGRNVELKIKGEVVWNREGNCGIRFLELTRRVKQELRLWLAQQYLAH